MLYKPSSLEGGFLLPGYFVHLYILKNLRVAIETLEVVFTCPHLCSRVKPRDGKEHEVSTKNTKGSNNFNTISVLNLLAHSGLVHNHLAQIKLLSPAEEVLRVRRQIIVISIFDKEHSEFE